jgi:hypothetical protein
LLNILTMARLSIKTMSYAAKVNADKVVLSVAKNTTKQICEFLYLRGFDFLNLITKNGRRSRKVISKLVHRELDQLKIPFDLKPTIRVINLKISDFAGSYHPTSNTLIINLAHSKKLIPGSQRLGRLDYSLLREICRHECKHVHQWTELARAGLSKQMKLPLPKRLARIAESKYPIRNLSPERLVLENSYHPFNLRVKHNRFSYLSELIARRQGFRSFNELLSKATSKQRSKFWQEFSSTFKNDSRYSSVLKHLDSIARVNIKKSESAYITHAFEVEARAYEKVFA